MATEDEDEERSLLFSDSEQESTFSNSNSSHHDNNHRSNNNNGENDSDDMEWEDFMIRYWSSSTAADSDDTQNDDDGFEMTAATAQSALKIVIMENTDLLPHPLEPELDHDISLLGNNYTKNIIPTERAAVSAAESSNYLDGETDVTMCDC